MDSHLDVDSQPVFLTSQFFGASGSQHCVLSQANGVGVGCPYRFLLHWPFDFNASLAAITWSTSSCVCVARMGAPRIVIFPFVDPSTFGALLARFSFVRFLASTLFCQWLYWHGTMSIPQRQCLLLWLLCCELHMVFAARLSSRIPRGIWDPLLAYLPFAITGIASVPDVAGALLGGDLNSGISPALDPEACSRAGSPVVGVRFSPASETAARVEIWWVHRLLQILQCP